MVDWASNGTARARVKIDNGRVRVTEWHFPQRGSNTGWHRHEYDYVIVPLFDGWLEILGPDGKRDRAKLTSGEPYFRERGIEHDVVSDNGFPCTFVEIELTG